jgi:hypothetical protein
MYDLYRAAIIWVWAPIFGESKFGSPFRRKINLPNCHATLVDFFWPTKFCFLMSVPDPCYVDLLMANRLTKDQPTERPTNQPTDQPTDTRSDRPQLDLSKKAEFPPNCTGII